MTPLSLDNLRAIAAALPATTTGTRDKAVILIGFASALRSCNIAALTMGDLEFCDKGLILAIRREKTDQMGNGRLIGIPRGKHKATCPVTALEAWLAYRGSEPGAVFCRVLSPEDEAEAGRNDAARGWDKYYREHPDKLQAKQEREAYQTQSVPGRYRSARARWANFYKKNPDKLQARLDREARRGKVDLRVPLRPGRICEIVQRAIRLIGIEGEFGSHSMRSGFITTAALAGVSELVISTQSGHKDFSTLRQYFRRQSVWHSNACEAIDL